MAGVYHCSLSDKEEEQARLSWLRGEKQGTDTGMGKAS